MTGPSFREAKKCYTSLYTGLCYYTKNMQSETMRIYGEMAKNHLCTTDVTKRCAKNVPYSTILDKNVKKNAPCMFNFRLLPSKPGSLKILTPPPRPPPPSKKTNNIEG